MSAYVFAGPSLERATVEAHGDLVWLPPATQGDVYRTALRRPRAIGIVDGYFEGVPAVWHKEILWAMAQGIHVFGGASMGALRASELHAFGMRGVGRIFEQYRDGALEDDDEVALLHGPAETGFAAVTEPMVNVRATLARACDESVVAPASAEALEQVAKAIFYQARTWDGILDEAERAALPLGELDALRAWLPGGGVDRKREDAVEMLAAMRALLAEDPGPLRVDYDFEWTEAWDAAVNAPLEAHLPFAAAAPADDDAAVLDELRLDAGRYGAARERALARQLALREADRRRVEADGGALRARLERLRRERGLPRRRDLDRFMQENRLATTDLEQLIADAARVDAVAARVEHELDAHVLAELRLSGEYARLVGRARAKGDAIRDALGRDHATPEDLGLTPLQLLSWYCEQRLGIAVPDDVDALVARLGLGARLELDGLLADDYLYSVRHKERPGDGVD